MLNENEKQRIIEHLAGLFPGLRKRFTEAPKAPERWHIRLQSFDVVDIIEAIDAWHDTRRTEPTVDDIVDRVETTVARRMGHRRRAERSETMLDMLADAAAHPPSEDDRTFADAMVQLYAMGLTRLDPDAYQRAARQCEAWADEHPALAASLHEAARSFAQDAMWFAHLEQAYGSRWRVHYDDDTLRQQWERERDITRSRMAYPMTPRNRA